MAYLIAGIVMTFSVFEGHLPIAGLFKCDFGICSLSHDPSLPSVLWRCWLGGRKGIRPVKTEWWDAGVVIWYEVQTCISPSRCHCHSLSLAPV